MKRLTQISAAVATLFAVACSSDGGTPPVEVDNTVANVSISGATTIAPSGSSQLTATPLNAAGAAISGLTATWSSSATSVATVSGTGLVTAVSSGTATITATISGKSGTRDVTVQTITVSPTATVTVANTNFAPTQVDISAGGTVTWNFDDYTAHTVVFSGSGTPANIAATASGGVERTFPNPGTYPYSCSIHYGMQGTVVVH